MNSPAVAAKIWREAVIAKGGNYYSGISTPEDRIASARRLYVAGDIDHTAFEASVSVALGLSPLSLAFSFAKAAA